MEWYKSYYKLGKCFDIFKPVIIVRLYGGLGNQLFTYAAAKRLSVFNNCKLYIDAGSGFIRDFKYKRIYQLAAFEISAQPSRWGFLSGFIFTYLRRLVVFLNEKLPSSKKLLIVQGGISFNSNLLTLHLGRPVIFEGYWQSEGYFKDIEFEIRSEFRFKQSIVDEMLPYVKQINFDRAVAIHVRHFRDEHHVNQGNINDDYYRKAIKLFLQRIPDAEFWLFSDNPMKALVKFKGIDIILIPITYLVKNSSEIKELFIMSQFRNFIIANSTFSWWGAWLSNYESKIVVAPAEKIYFGEGLWGFEGLLPEQWIKL